MKTINLFENSYCFSSIETTLNVSKSFIEYSLAKQYEYRPTTESLWASITENGKEIARYELIYGKGLFQIELN